MKFYYLRTYLTGKVLDKIKGLPMTNENFDRAWTTLTEYYENNRRLVTSHLSELFSVKPMKTESSVELKRLFKETFNPLDGLNSLDRGAYKFEDFIVFLTASRFDQITRREWKRHLGSNGEPPTLAQLREFSKSQILTLESVEGGSKSYLNSAKSNKSVVFTNVAQSSSKIKTQLGRCAIRTTPLREINFTPKALLSTKLS